MATAIQILDAKKVKRPTYYIVLELGDYSYIFAEHAIEGLNPDGYGLSFESAINSKLQLFKGRASLSEITFRLSDKDGQVKELLRRDILNGRMTAYRGYRDLPLEEFELCSIGHIMKPELKRDGSFLFHSRDYRTLLAGDLFNIPWGKATLSAAVNSSATTLPLNAGGVHTFMKTQYYGWLTDPRVSQNEFTSGGGQYCVIDDEIMEVTGYDGDDNFLYVTRAALGTSAAAHSDDSEVSELFVFKEHPIRLLLHSITTGPDGLNGMYDMGIPGWGLDIPSSYLDISSFLDYIAFDVPDLQHGDFVFWLTGKESGGQFIEDELLKILIGYLVVNRAGRLRLRLFDIPPHNGWPQADPATIDEMEIMSGPGWEYDLANLFNSINYGFGYNPVDSEYEFESTYKARISINTYDVENEISFYSKGLRIGDPGDNSGGFNFLMASMQRLFNLAVQGFPVVKARMPMTRQMLEPGQIITVNHKQIPNMYDTGGLSQDMVVLNNDIKYGRGIVNVELLQSEFPRRFEMLEQTQYTDTTNYTIAYNASNSDLDETGDIIAFWHEWGLSGYGEYDQSDVMQIDFLIVGPSGGTGGTADLALRYRTATSVTPIATILFRLTYLGGSSNNRYEIIFPNFRENVYSLKWDYYDYSGFAPTNNEVIITRARYYNPEYILAGP